MLKTFRKWRRRNTKETDELLSAYLDGLLQMDERAALEARLRQEPDLVAQLEGLRLTVSALRDLPRVETPRNFILSPSMVAQPRAATHPRQPRVWPVFGWATAAVALMFLLVFGSDVFIVAPSLRSQSEVSGVEKFQTIVQTPSHPAILSPTGEPGVAPVEAEAYVEPRLEKEAVTPESVSGAVESEVAVEVETIVEAEIVVETEAPTAVARGMMGATVPSIGDGTATVATDISEKVVEAEAHPADEGEVGLAQVTPIPERAPPQSGEEAEATAIEEAFVISPESAPTAVVEGVPQVVSPAAEMEATESDMETQTLPERTWTPDAIAVVPLTAPTPAVDTEQVAKSVPLWLRLLEVGLGLAVVALGTVTLVLRARKG